MTHGETLGRLERALAARAGRLEHADAATSRAAVAVVLRPDGRGSADVLFIERAVFEGDPWSGQVAFPGGRAEAGDASLLETAVRETREEIGGDLSRAARLVGTLDEIHPRTPVLPAIVVRPHVFVLEEELPIERSHEVADTFWVPLATLLDPATTREVSVRARGLRLRVPGFVVGERVIWGMTERFLRQLLALVSS
ncbi:MAG: CoA pyrophosphatase [Gemmatimonadetes bacterium]|nr:CoA pyrophosphatase [Gemmatimonadota bacterium]